MDSIAAATGWPNSPTRATSEASPPASGAAVVTSTGVPASFMACTSRRVLLRSNPTCSMGPGLLPSRLSALTSSVLRGEAPVFMAFSGSQGAEQVDLDHLPVVVALTAVERPEQHDAGVVDQDVGAAEFLAPPVGGRHEAGAVGDV